MMNLPQLTYYPEWILKIYPTGKRVWYLIPYEILNDGWEDEIVYCTKYIRSSYGIYLYGRTFKKWLEFLTNYTEEQWYRRYILNILIDNIDKCPICGNPYLFNNISHGYSATCVNPRSCNMYTWMSDDNFYQESINRLNSVQSQALGRCTQFKNMGNLDDPCALYISFTVNFKYYKFGITSDYVESRKRAFYGSNKYYHIVITNTRDNIAELEKSIKLKLNSISEHVEVSKIKQLKDSIRDSIKELNLTNLFDKNIFYIC